MDKLGQHPYKIAISRDEINLVHRVRLATGIPMQTWIRKMIREEAVKVLERGN
jgi:hypothetical protein